MNFKDEDAQLIWEAHLLEALERDSETGEPQQDFKNIRSTGQDNVR